MLSPTNWRAALALHKQGWSYPRLAKHLGCSRMTVARHLGGLSLKGARRAPKDLRLYRIWDSMRRKCTSAKSATYRHYGGRGIRFTRDSFAAFESWARKIAYRPGQALRRKDDDVDFSPANCYWGARRRDGAAARLAAFGESKTVAQWTADVRCVVTADALHYRLRHGVAPEIAITTPMKAGQQGLPKTRKAAKRLTADRPRAVRLRRRGMTAAAIAAQLGVPYSTIQVGLLKRLGHAPAEG